MGGSKKCWIRWPNQTEIVDGQNLRYQILQRQKTRYTKLNLDSYYNYKVSEIEIM